MNNQIYETPNQEVVGQKSSSGTLSFAKIFFYMFLGLALTTGVAFGVGALLLYKCPDFTVFRNVYLGLMIGSGVTLIIMTFVINLVFLRGKHSILIPALIYCILMGVLLSTFVILLEGNWWLLGEAFGITAGVFLILTLIAVVSKGNMSPLLMLGFGLIMGSGILILVNLLTRSSTLYWVISFAIFAAMMFITIFDIWNIKKITERGEMTTNLELYCAFTLYVDFIYILIRVIYFLLFIYGRSK